MVKENLQQIMQSVPKKINDLNENEDVNEIDVLEPLI